MTSKERLIRLLKLLYSESDESHPITTKQIAERFRAMGTPTDRNTVTDDIAILNGSGIEIIAERGRQLKYYFADRRFELAELKLLIDAVESSKFITAKKSDQLVQKLITMTSTQNAKELQRHLYTAGRIKPENESIFYVVDAVHKAINERKQISFVYCEYSVDRKLVEKRDGEPYIFSPYAMLYNEDKYYALGYSEHHQKVITFRVDRMKTPEILDKPIVPAPTNFDPVDYTVNVFSMYDGDSSKVVLKCKNHLMNYVVDRFGDEFKSERTGDDCFLATIEASVSQTFFAWVFQFDGNIQIVSPASVKERYQEMLSKAGKQ